MEKPNSLQQAIQYFADQQVCIDTIAKLRWPNGPECPACGHKEHYYLKSQRRWKCKDCHKQFSVKLGTIFEDSPISLDKWLIALWMLVNCRNGISSYEVGRALGITQKSGWFVLHRLRLALKEGIETKIGGAGKEVEADESFIGGKFSNMHMRKRMKLQKTRDSIIGNAKLLNKAAVMGLFDRELRKVRATVVPAVNMEVLRGEIEKHVAEGTKLYTDQAAMYRGLPAIYGHEFVNHLRHYVQGKVHTNSLDNFWSLLKRALKGSYIAVEPFHLFRYVDEQAFRFNNRLNESGKRLKDGERFDRALSQIAGKRLTYSEVTGKDGSSAPN